MCKVQATQIFGSKVFTKSAENMMEARKIAKSYYVANCNVVIYDEDNNRIPYYG